MQRFAGVAAAELVPVFQAEGNGRLVGGWQRPLHSVQVSSVSLNYNCVWANTTKISALCGIKKAFPYHVCLHMNFKCSLLLKNGNF